MHMHAHKRKKINDLTLKGPTGRSTDFFKTRVYSTQVHSLSRWMTDIGSWLNTPFIIFLNRIAVFKGTSKWNDINIKLIWVGGLLLASVMSALMLSQKSTHTTRARTKVHISLTYYSFLFIRLLVNIL